LLRVIVTDSNSLRLCYQFQLLTLFHQQLSAKQLLLSRLPHRLVQLVANRLPCSTPFCPLPVRHLADLLRLSQYLSATGCSSLPDFNAPLFLPDSLLTLLFLDARQIPSLITAFFRRLSFSALFAILFLLRLLV